MATAQVLKCNACGGVYRSIQADGTEYYHACPADRVTTQQVVDPVTLKVTTPEVRTPFVNRRDENIVVDKNAGTVSQKAPGAGTTTVNDAATIAALGLT